MLSDRRNDFGVKESADQYRRGGERVLWLDGMVESITSRVIEAIRAAGIKCWRTKNQVWVNAADVAKIYALNIDYDSL